MQRLWGREEHENRRSQKRTVGQGDSGVGRMVGTVAGPVMPGMDGKDTPPPRSPTHPTLRLIPGLHPRGCKPFTCIDFRLTDLQSVHACLFLIITSLNSMHLLLAVRGLPCCSGFSPVAELGLLLALAFPVRGRCSRVQALRRLRCPGPRAQAQALWALGLVALPRVASSQIRDGTCVS